MSEMIVRLREVPSEVRDAALRELSELGPSVRVIFHLDPDVVVRASEADDYRSVDSILRRLGVPWASWSYKVTVTSTIVDSSGVSFVSEASYNLEEVQISESREIDTIRDHFGGIVSLEPRKGSSTLAIQGRVVEDSRDE